MVFSGLGKRQGIASWNINVLCHNFSYYCWICLPSILYFTCWTRFVLVFFLLHWSQYYIVFVDCLNACDDNPVRQRSCTDNLNYHNRLLNMGMIWCRKNCCWLLNKLTSLKIKSLFLNRYSCYCLSMITYIMNDLLFLSTYATSSSRVHNVKDSR